MVTQEFKSNSKGGWIIPGKTNLTGIKKIPAYSAIGKFCEIGNDCEIGDNAIISDYCKIGDGCIIGDLCKIGDLCNIGVWCKIGSGCRFGDLCAINNYCNIRNRCIIGIKCTIGNFCKIGDNCEIGAKCEIWHSLKYGKELIMEGKKVNELLTLSNIHDLKGQILIIWHDDGVLIRSGCFKGTGEEFLEKAESEGKLNCAKVVKVILDVILEI